MSQGGECPSGAEKGMGMQILLIFGIGYAFFSFSSLGMQIFLFCIGNANFFFHWECNFFLFLALKKKLAQGGERPRGASVQGGRESRGASDPGGRVTVTP